MRPLPLATGLLLATLLSAQAQEGPGALRCSVQGGFGVIVASNKAVTCTYRRAGQPVEFYTGYATNVGLDIGPTNATSVTYTVSATAPTSGGLQGDFVGPEVGVAGGAGVAARGLVGNGVVLVPIPNTATTAYTGLNATVGLTRLHLRFVGIERVDRRRGVEILRSYGIQDEN